MSEEELTNRLPRGSFWCGGSLHWLFSLWDRGSAIARFVGVNVTTHEEFDPIAKMWVFEEMFEGRKLTEIINTEHENKKYLPGFRLPESIVAGPFSVEYCFEPSVAVVHCRRDGVRPV